MPSSGDILKGKLRNRALVIQKSVPWRVCPKHTYTSKEIPEKEIHTYNIMSKTIKVEDLPADTEALLRNLFKGKQNGFRRFGVDGVVLPRSYESHADAVRAVDVRPDDVWLITYPRSGTTMTCEILWLMMNNLDYEKAAKTHMFRRRHFLEFFTFLYEQSQDLDTNPSLRDFPIGYRLAASSPSPRLMVTHLPLSLLPPEVLDVAKVVFLARDPRDVAVSWYHLLRLYRCFDYVGEFKKFWELFIEDSILFTPFFPRLKESWAQRNHPNMLFLFYEDMIKDIPGTLQKISSFCGKQYTCEELLILADHLAIDKFRQNQSVQSVLETIPGMKNETGESFIRKGKSGGWRAHFDEDMRQQAESWIQRNLEGTDISFP